MTDDFKHVDDPDAPLHVLLEGYEECALSFHGDDDTGTVTMYVVDPETYQPLFPVLECEAEHFELLLEQASGAKMNAEGDYPQTDL